MLIVHADHAGWCPKEPRGYEALAEAVDEWSAAERAWQETQPGEPLIGLWRWPLLRDVLSRNGRKEARV